MPKSETRNILGAFSNIYHITFDTCVPMIEIIYMKKRERDRVRGQTSPARIVNLFFLLFNFLRNQTDFKSSGKPKLHTDLELTLKTGPKPPSPSLWVGWKSLVAASKVSKGKSFCSCWAILSKSSSFCPSDQSKQSKNRNQIMVRNIPNLKRICKNRNWVLLLAFSWTKFEGLDEILKEIFGLVHGFLEFQN